MNYLQRMIYRVPTGMPTGVCVLAILWLTLAPKPFGDQPVHAFPGADKVVHACMFGGLMFLAEFDRARYKIKRRHLNAEAALAQRPTAVVIAAAIIGFGGAIELIQGVMHLGRGADWMDWLADMAGVAIAAWVGPAIIRRLLR